MPTQPQPLEKEMMRAMPRTRVLIAGSSEWHDLLAAGVSIRQTLLAAWIPAQLAVGLGSQQVNAEADVFVLYTMGARMTAAEQSALAAQVAAGKGLVLLHSSTVQTPAMAQDNHDVYFRLIGCRFRTHPPFCRFRVQIRDGGQHPITRDLSDFEIEDELYITEWTGETGSNAVLATASHEGVAHPMVYTRAHGAGRVCGIALGHDGRAWSHPQFRQLLTRAVVWAAGT